MNRMKLDVELHLEGLSVPTSLPVILRTKNHTIY